MKLNFPLLSSALCLVFLSFGSCKKSEQTTQKEDAIPAEETNQEVEQVAVSGSKSSHQTKSGKTFEVQTEPQGSSVMNISISSNGFSANNGNWSIEGADPLSDTFIADLDKNGFEELYLITTSAGSGSYGTIYGYASNNDKSATQIYIPEISESDMAPGGKFAGYMGHDSIFLDQGVLYRKFPIYNEGDENCCPSGGDRQLQYLLQPGEASWILKIKD